MEGFVKPNLRLIVSWDGEERRGEFCCKVQRVVACCYELQYNY